MANSVARMLVCGFSLCFAAGVVAEDEEDEQLDMEFLEYLGMWEESDEDWQLLDEDEGPQNDERSDPVPEGEESPEKDDEG